MAIKLATAHKNIPLSDAYHRIVGIISDRDQGYLFVRYGVWQDEAAAVVVLPNRELLDTAEADLQAFIETRAEDENYEAGLTFRQRTVENLRNAFREGTKTVNPVLEHLTKRFPYSPDADVSRCYLLLKTLPEFAGAVDV